jgi:hypothetical protein
MTRIPSTTAAMLGAAAVTAQCVVGKATRDALFLTTLDFTALPAMLVAASLVSILLLAAYARAAHSIDPAVLMPALLIGSGTMFAAEWALRAAAPEVIAVTFYLHATASAALVASGFWLTVSERFDPRTAKRRIGHIAGAGTVGGLLGAVLAERVAAAAGVPAMILCLAGFQFLAAMSIRRGTLPRIRHARAEVAAEPFHSLGKPSHSALRVVAESPHLRHLGVLVLLGTTSAALLDYLFKAQVVETFGRGDNLLRFFAIYYAATGLITFVLQTASSRVMLERFGLGLMTSTPSLALVAGSIAGLIAPGFGSLLLARGGEAIFRGSWFRSGYELFYTPVATHEKRVAKSLIDVGFDRLGDALGGGLIRSALVLAPAAQSPTILVLAMITSVGAVIASSRLNHWYMQTLAKRLVSDAGDVRSLRADDSLRQRLVDVRGGHDEKSHDTNMTTGGVRAQPLDRAMPVFVHDPELRDAIALRSRNPDAAIDILSGERGLTGALIHDTIPLLAEESLGNHAMFALCKVAEEHVGQLGDALLDPGRAPAIRRRLARVFSVCVSQRAANVLMMALTDTRFEVRFQAARSLAAIRDKNPGAAIDRQRIYDLVAEEINAVPLVPDGYSEPLAHVFTLLSLVIAREPLRVAYRSLRSEDLHLRGTALEYLEGVLPSAIRRQLWPLLVQPPALAVA